MRSNGDANPAGRSRSRRPLVGGWKRSPALAAGLSWWSAVRAGLAKYGRAGGSDGERLGLSAGDAGFQITAVPPPRSWQDVRTWFYENAFAPSWLHGRWNHRAVGYLVGVLLQVVAALATLGIIQAIPTFAVRGGLFDLVVVFVALNFGAGPGLIATLAGATLLTYVVFPPHFSVLLEEQADLVGTTAMLLVGLFLSRMVSQRERARRTAQAAVRRMDDFLGVASHELRTPMTVLKASIQFARRLVQRSLRQAMPEGDDTRNQMVEVLTLLDRAEMQLDRQNRLIGDLVDASRIQTNQFILRPHPCDLAAVVREAVEAQQIVQPARVIRLGLPDHLPVPVLADADRLGQVVTHFLTNALKYSEDHLPVEVELLVRDGYARVSVADHGPGISKAEQEHIWDVFHRASGVEVRSGSSVGLGLGLYISRKIMERLGGQIGVQSVPGQGATFWFALPLIGGSASA